MAETKRRWVVNASPVIVLARVGVVHLLEVLSAELVVPSRVAVEIQAGAADDPGRQWLMEDGQHYIQDAPTDPLIAAWDLGPGETDVFSWSRHHNDFEALVDDRAARECARALDMQVRGTLGILLLAKQEGLIDEVRPLLDAVRHAGLWVTAGVAREVLQLADEME